MQLNLSEEILKLIERDESFKKRFQLLKKSFLCLKDEPLFFKGGTVLTFFYRSERFSFDLDFDVLLDPSEFSILEISNKLSKELKFEVTVSKNTETTKRLKIKTPEPLKIEFSFRRFLKEKQISRERKKKKREIQVYSISELLEMKAACIRRRSQARDVFDFGFILDRYFSQLEPEALKKAYEVFLDFEVETLLSEVENSFLSDSRLDENKLYLTYERLLRAKERLLKSKLKVFRLKSSSFSRQSALSGKELQ